MNCKDSENEDINQGGISTNDDNNVPDKMELEKDGIRDTHTKPVLYNEDCSSVDDFNNDNVQSEIVDDSIEEYIKECNGDNLPSGTVEIINENDMITGDATKLKSVSTLDKSIKRSWFSWLKIW